jgi:hypothetical protein
MFITCEEDGLRVVYDLRDGVRYEVRNGTITANKIVDKKIFELMVMHTEFVDEGDILHIGRWLTGASRDTIRDEKLAIARHKANGVTVVKV